MHYLAGLIGMLGLACCMVFCALGLFIGVTPHAITLVLAFAAAFLWVLYLNRADTLRVVGAGVIAIVALVASCLIAGWFHDFSVDGNAYHKLAVAALQGGWNPLQESVDQWSGYGEIYDFKTNAYVWVTHYAHGLWYISAALYDITGNIEMAKGYTLYAMVCVALLLFGFLRSARLRGWQRTLIALIAVVNPITVVQFTTFYCDAFLMLALFALFIGLVGLTYPACAQTYSLSLTLVVAAFILCGGTKFTGLAYAGVFVLPFCVLLLIHLKRRVAHITVRRVVTTAAVFIAMLVVSVLVVGYASYVMNFLNYGHPFYPLMGEGAYDIMVANQPSSFANASIPEKLFTAFFSACGDVRPSSGALPELKIPLTFSQAELDALSAPDVQMSGFGVWYSAILLIGLVLSIIALVKSWKRDRFFFEVFVAYMVPTLLLLFMLSDSWWARYSTYVYAANIFLLVYMFSRANSAWQAESVRSVIGWSVVTIIFTGLLVMNTALSTYASLSLHIDQSRTFNQQLHAIEQDIENGAELKVTYYWMPGTLYTLRDRGIPYTIDLPFEEAEGYGEQRLCAIYYKLVPIQEGVDAGENVSTHEGKTEN